MTLAQIPLEKREQKKKNAVAQLEMFLLNVLVILFAVVVYQNQEDLMGKMGLLSQEKICLTAKVRLKKCLLRNIEIMVYTTLNQNLELKG